MSAPRTWPFCSHPFPCSRWASPCSSRCVATGYVCRNDDLRPPPTPFLQSLPYSIGFCPHLSPQLERLTLYKGIGLVLSVVRVCSTPTHSPSTQAHVHSRARYADVQTALLPLVAVLHTNKHKRTHAHTHGNGRLVWVD